ncbi:MAG: T9SS type A sorting domain-containing protein, partial [Bacteroidota bacterium]
FDIPMSCGGTSSRTFKLTIQPWDEVNNTWGTKVNGGSVTLDVSCPVVVPAFATTPCAGQNNELSVTCPACPCTFDNDNMTITVEVSGTHTYVSDLEFYLSDGSGTTVLLGNSSCANNGDDFSGLTFTSSAGGAGFDACNAPTPLSGTHNVDFFLLDGAGINGNWELLVRDCVGQDNGNLTNYTVTISPNNANTCLTGNLVVSSSMNAPIPDNDCSVGLVMPLNFTALPGMADTPIWTTPDGTTLNTSTIVPAFAEGENMANYTVQCPCSDPCPKEVIAVRSDCLPVELLSFTAIPNNMQQVDLHWTTATELDNSHFEIERSADGHKFQLIGKVLGVGTSVSLQKYTYTDIAPDQAVNYYRLKQVDFAGTYDYSEVVVVELGKQTSIKVFPSPVHDLLHIQANASISAIKVINVTGEIVLSNNNLSDASLELEVTSLLTGTYFISVTTQQGQTDILRFVKH